MFQSSCIFLESKLHEALILGQNFPARCASVCALWRHFLHVVGRYDDLTSRMWSELLQCIYAAPLRADLDSAGEFLEADTWFERYQRMARRCDRLEAMLAEANEKAHAIAGAAEQRQRALDSAIAGWQEALAEFYSTDEATSEAARVLGTQVACLLSELQATERTVSDLSATARRKASAGVEESPQSNAARRNSVRKNFHELPLTDRTNLAHELVASLHS